MKFSKTWCGFFSVVGSLGAGLGLTAYVANKGSALCQNAMESFIQSFLNGKLDLSGKNATISFEILPRPVQLSLTNFSFSLRETLANSLVQSLEGIPKNIGNACEDFVWEQGTIILLVCVGFGSLFFYNACKKPTVINTVINHEPLLGEQNRI